MANQSPTATAFSAEGQDITLGNAYEQTRDIYDRARAMTSKRQPTKELLRRFMREIVAALKNRGRRYYFFGGATTLEEDDDKDNALYQGRRFVEVDINVAGWGSFPLFEIIRDALIQLPGDCGLSLPRNELLKLKLAGWAEKSRREGPKKRNGILDIIALREVMYMEGEFLDKDDMAANMKEGLKFWLQEMTDDAEWRRIGVLL